jgi:hypothetical protein
VTYSIPKEGAVIWLDNFAIPADAPHVDNAHAFINFMLRPDIAARNSNYVFYANGNKASQEQIDEEVINDPAIYPPRRGRRKTLYDDAKPTARPARDDPHLDGGQDRPVRCIFWRGRMRRGRRIRDRGVRRGKERTGLRPPSLSALE